jgi:iron complex outermembrane receptor protein
VEVVRGAATLRYGSQAIGGVVNAISNRVPTRVADGTLRGELLGEFGSGADSRSFAGQFDLRRDALALHADAFDRDADDYDTPDGALANSWLRARGAALGGAWIGAQDHLGLGATRHESRYGIPGETSFIDMAQTKLSLRSGWGLRAGPWRKLSVDGGWADYEHSEIEDGAAVSTFKDREWDARAEAVGGSWGVFTATALGLQLQQRDFAALGEGADFLQPATTQSRAVFAFAEAPLTPALRLQFGVRIERVHIDGTSSDDVATSRRFTPLSGSAGLVHDVNDRWRLGLALSSAARAPAQIELFAGGPHDGPLTFETGDPALRMERAGSLEASIRFRGGRVHADGSVWIMRFDDYIHGALTGNRCDEDGNCAPASGAELKELFYVQRDARFRGAEGHAEIELLQGAAGDLHVELLADVVRATLDGGGAVPRIPPFHIGGGLAWQSRHLDARVTVKYAGRQDRLAAAETVTGDYLDVGVQFAVRPWLARPGIEFVLLGRNLGDSRQRNAVAMNKDEVLLPGRDLRLLVRATFE